jgi:Fe-S cluster biogenesis protein NfuA
MASNQELNKQVKEALDELREPLVAHGGDIELVEANPETGEVKVRLHGACVGCPLAGLTIKEGIESSLVERVPGVTSVMAVE